MRTIAAPAISPRNRSVAQSAALFVLMATIWGTTWIASAVGLRHVRPILFASMRYLVTAAVLTLLVRDIKSVFSGVAWVRTAMAGLLTNTATYSLLFWALTVAPSGVIGLVDLAMTPVVLYLFAIGLKEETFNWRVACALGLGLTGLLIIFTAKASWASGLSGGGMIAALLAVLTYGAGSIISRPLLAHASPLAVTAGQAIVGGPALLVLAALVEPPSWADVHSLLDPQVVAAIAYLVVFGTIVAFSIYLTLLRDWGVARAGLYAFVSPVIALLVGAIFLGEQLTISEVIGAAMMLLAACFALKRAERAFRASILLSTPSAD